MLKASRYALQIWKREPFRRASVDDGELYAPGASAMNDETQAVARGSATLVWTLIASSFGLAAGVAIALLMVAALLWVP